LCRLAATSPVHFRELEWEKGITQVGEINRLEPRTRRPCRLAWRSPFGVVLRYRASCGARGGHDLPYCAKPAGPIHEDTRSYSMSAAHRSRSRRENLGMPFR